MSRLVALPMRCAAHGNPFHALFEWNGVRNEYVLVEAIGVEEASCPDGRGTEAAKPASSSLARLSRSLVGLKGKSPGTTQPLSTEPQGSSSLKESPQEFNLSKFNFSGFSCPVCGYGEKAPLTQGIAYVKCGKCNELACGVRVSEVRGSLAFRCHDKCGGGGMLRDGSSEPMTASGVLGEFLPSSRATGSAARDPENPQVPGSTAISLPPPDRER